jgi:hypothetical protein
MNDARALTEGHRSESRELLHSQAGASESVDPPDCLWHLKGARAWLDDIVDMRRTKEIISAANQGDPRTALREGDHSIDTLRTARPVDLRQADDRPVQTARAHCFLCATF